MGRDGVMSSLVVEWRGPPKTKVGKRTEDIRRAKRSLTFSDAGQAAHWLSALLLDGRCQDIRLTEEGGT